MNKTFKDFVKEDLSVFFNAEEFANLHEIDGENVLAIIVDNDSTDNIAGFTREQAYATQEVFKVLKTIYVKSAEFYVPKVDSEITIDGEKYFVEATGDENGVIRIVVSAYES